MITVEMVREKGFELVAQDVINVSYPENDPDYEVIGNRYLDEVNEKNPPWNDCDVKEFAWRDNKGEMPCDGELLVEVKIESSSDSAWHVVAGIMDWSLNFGGCNIVKWRPSLKNWESKMNLDKIETQEEKEAFEGMVKSSDIPNSSGWKNGDECIYMNHKVVHQFVGQCPNRDGYGYIQAPTFEINFVELSKLSKPESPKQKAERERLDAIKEIQRDMEFYGSDFCAAERLYDKGYRKQNV